MATPVMEKFIASEITLLLVIVTELDPLNVTLAVVFATNPQAGELADCPMKQSFMWVAPDAEIGCDRIICDCAPPTAWKIVGAGIGMNLDTIVAPAALFMPLVESPIVIGAATERANVGVPLGKAMIPKPMASPHS